MQEPAVALQELPHVVRGILLVEEELRGGVPPPFKIRVVDVKEQLVLVVIQRPLGFALIASKPRIRRL